eukprot:10935731-Karenia_brevis.AAC.1
MGVVLGGRGEGLAGSSFSVRWRGRPPEEADAFGGFSDGGRSITLEPVFCKFSRTTFTSRGESFLFSSEVGLAMSE